MSHYYSGDALALGVTPRQIQAWAETGLVPALEQRARRRIYDLDGFRRLLLARDLTKCGLSHRARVILPAITLPPAECWVITNGRGFNQVEVDPLKALSAAMGARRPVCIVRVPWNVGGGK